MSQAALGPEPSCHHPSIPFLLVYDIGGGQGLGSSPAQRRTESRAQALTGAS